MDHQDYYRALLARDARFDGYFYVGVTSTGIYCRPICRVRTPKSENCRFFVHAATAESEGFRPCLRCRPELAPANASLLQQDRLIQVAVCLIAQGYLDVHGCVGLAAKLGISDRHLRRLFEQHFGVSPIAYAQSQRLLLAKRLLMDTLMPVSQIALCAGFGSLRRFNETFIDRYRLTPSALRKSAMTIAEDQPSGEQVFELSYRPPLAVYQLLSFWRDRQMQGVEIVEDNSYERTLQLDCQGNRVRGWYRVIADPQASRLQVIISDGLMPAVMQVLQLVRRQFDLDADPDSMAVLFDRFPTVPAGLRVPGAISGFEVVIRSIVEQVISTKAATTLVSKLVATFGEPLSGQDAEGTNLRFLFPTAGRLSQVGEDSWRAMGLSRSKGRAIQAVSLAVASGELDLDNVVDIPAMIAQLQMFPGIGVWTSEYVALRAWQWPDSFLDEDYVIKKMLPNFNRQARLAWATPFRPWRSYLVFAMWWVWQHESEKWEYP